MINIIKHIDGSALWSHNCKSLYVPQYLSWEKTHICRVPDNTNYHKLCYSIIIKIIIIIKALFQEVAHLGTPNLSCGPHPKEEFKKHCKG